MSSRETKPKLADLRKSYDKATLDLDHVKDNPLQFFQTWFYEAKEADDIDEANAMSLTTLGDDGFPRARVVLLKDFSEEGFVFFTNYNSEKGKSLLKHPKVGLSFYWPSLERQIIIKGEAEKLSENKSDRFIFKILNYFFSIIFINRKIAIKCKILTVHSRTHHCHYN